MLTIEARAIGRRRPLIPRWDIPLPPAPTGPAEPLTLRALITRIVLEEVAAYRSRQAERRLLRVLSDAQIADAAAKGRVIPGPRDIPPGVDVDESTAVGTALQAFEDALFLVFIDGREHRDLDEQVFPGPDSTITFVRLVALAGA